MQPNVSIKNVVHFAYLNCLDNIESKAKLDFAAHGLIIEYTLPLPPNTVVILLNGIYIYFKYNHLVK